MDTKERFAKLVSEHGQWAKSYGGDRPLLGSQLVLHDTLLSDLNMYSADLSSCEIAHCRVVNSKFEKCDFSSATLVATRFERCFFMGCHFRKAELLSADCRTSGFEGCDFTKADLTEANFFGTSLTRCSFKWAWLVDCDMREAIMEGIDFSEARLSGTKLYNTRRYHLSGSNGAVVKNVDFSPQADGSVLMGDEVFRHLQIY